MHRGKNDMRDPRLILEQRKKRQWFIIFRRAWLNIHH
jgi:hypothetical protein